jgi:sulfate adenylyltransferase (ADP) / ATP adenylyltransferase
MAPEPNYLLSLILGAAVEVGFPFTLPISISHLLSVASQPHRHVQFLPVESMKRGDGSDWTPLYQYIASAGQSSSTGLFSHPEIPFAHHAAQITPEIPSAQLHERYLSLFDAALASLHKSGNTPSNGQLSRTGEGGFSVMSYNLAMTTSLMMICPRRKDGGLIRRDDGSDAGDVGLNGTVLAGTLMVKDEEQWNLLSEGGHRLDSLLQEAGVPSVG